MLKAFSCEWLSYSPLPLPIPVPPLESTEPFRIVIQPQRPFQPDPIPVDTEPPLTNKELSPTVWIVIFESAEHSSPPLLSPRETIEFVPAPMSVAELPEIVTAAVVFTVMSSKITVTLLFLISMLFRSEDPNIKTVPMKV
jgi:hypothetical protein